MSDLLDQKLEVSSVCEQLIRKSKKQYVTIAVLFSIISLIGLVALVHRAYIYSQREFRSENLDLNEKIYPYLMILYMFLCLFQLYYYFKAITNQKNAVDNTDQNKFETSFKYYINGNKLNIISLALYLFIQLFPLATAFINE